MWFDVHHNVYDVRSPCKEALCDLFGYLVSLLHSHTPIHKHVQVYLEG